MSQTQLYPACSIGGCERAIKARRLCSKHYLAQYYKANRERAVQQKRAHYLANKDVYKSRAKAAEAAAFAANPDAVRRRKNEWTTKYPARNALKAQRRRALLSGADVRLVTERDWQRLLARYGHCCAYCGASGQSLARDHIIPLHLGGRHSIGNLLPACRQCNSSKGARLLVRWRRSLHPTLTP